MAGYPQAPGMPGTPATRVVRAPVAGRPDRAAATVLRTARAEPDRRLLILGGLSGIAAGVAYFTGQAVFHHTFHDLPVEASQWTVVVGFWTPMLMFPFMIVMAYAIERLIASERDGALNQLGFVFAVVAAGTAAIFVSFQTAIPLVLTDEIKAEGSSPEAWDRIYTGLRSVDDGVDLAWDLFVGLWMLCIGVAMLRHPRLGARWGVPAVALVPPFFALNMAATPDPPTVDLGPLIGIYFVALSVQLVRLGARSSPKKGGEPWQPPVGTSSVVT